MGTNWLDTTYNVLNTADQFAAGFGDAVSFGATTKIRELQHGNLATRNHEGGWFTGGQITGAVASTLAGFGTPDKIWKGLTWTQRGLQAYNVIGTGVGAYQGTRNLLDGCGSALDLLNFAPAIGHLGSQAWNKFRRLGDSVPGPVNFMSNSDRFFLNASKRPDIDPKGFFDVVAHGSPNKIQIETPNGSVLIDHRAAARLIQQQPSYNGQNIRLLSCSTGACDTGFAQNLANKLKVDVHAPTDILWAYSNGKLVVASPTYNNKPDLRKLGTIKIFSPVESK
jgi:hypothetical protein